MRINYSVLHPGQDPLNSLPRLSFSIQAGENIVETVGLVDSGAMVNVLPFSIGQNLGFVWDDEKATIRLAGVLSGLKAIPVTAVASISGFAPIRLAFAWSSNDQAPLF